MMRRASLISGLVVLASLWAGSLPALAAEAFFAHMTLHMGVVAVAAPLIALGTAGRRWDPVRAVPRVFSPIPASVVELVVVWAWHAPGLHHAARESLLMLVLEQGSFLLAGLLVWLSVFGGGSLRRSERAATGIVALLLTSMHMTLLGALLALTPRPLYDHVEGALNMSPLFDQHLGGAIMILVGGVSYLAGGIYLTIRLLRRTALERRDSP